MNEAETRAELIDPALAAAGWGVVEGSRILIGPNFLDPVLIEWATNGLTSIMNSFFSTASTKIVLENFFIEF
jgi:hypothetical protein